MSGVVSGIKNVSWIKNMRRVYRELVDDVTVLRMKNNNNLKNLFI